MKLLAFFLGAAVAANSPAQIRFKGGAVSECVLQKDDGASLSTTCDLSVAGVDIGTKLKALESSVESLKECQYTSWGSWDPCSNSCDGIHEFRVGIQERERSVARQAIDGKAQCKAEDLDDSRACNTKPCSVHCKIGAWSGWSTCSTTCDGGSQYRTRVNTSPKNGGNKCPPSEDDKEYKECNLAPCAATYLGHPMVSYSGVHKFNINGKQFSTYVYKGDGGTWAKVWQSPGSHVSLTASGINDHSSCFLGSGVGCNAKLPDDAINALCQESGPHAGGWTTWRVSGSDTGKKAYFRSTRKFSNPSRSAVFNLYQSGHTQVQESSCSTCRGFRTSHWHTIDSLHWHRGGGDVGNNQERYFMDYHGSVNPGCYHTGSHSHRCFSSGSSTGHRSIPNQALWCRTT